MQLQISLTGRKDLSGEIYRQVRVAILSGRLRARDPLPPSRELARSLAVSRTTVTIAYDRLAREGFVSARVGAGTVVSERAARGPAERARRIPASLQGQTRWAEVRSPTVFDRPAQFEFRAGLPDPSMFPHKTWRRLVALQLRADERLGRAVYSHPAGHRPLCEAIARHVGVARGVETSADDVTITAGSQQALDAVARALLAPGDRVAVEDPGYPLRRWLFESLGLRVISVPVDGEGLVVERLPRGTRLVVVTPSHQFPLGVSMSLPRRLALLAWADRNQAAIVEDDYDSEFRFGGHPIEPLETLDTTGRVIYIGTFSKTLLPTLRLGFIITPPSLTVAVQKAKFVLDWHTSLLGQGALARFIDGGGFAHHIRKVGAVYRLRHETITRVLERDFQEHLEPIPSRTGLHLATVSRTASVEQIADVAQRASDMGVEFLLLSRFTVDTPVRPGIVLGFGAIPTAQIPEGLRRLRACFGK